MYDIWKQKEKEKKSHGRFYYDCKCAADQWFLLNDIKMSSFLKYALWAENITSNNRVEELDSKIKWVNLKINVQQLI